MSTKFEYKLIELTGLPASDRYSYCKEIVDEFLNKSARLVKVETSMKTSQQLYSSIRYYLEKFKIKNIECVRKNNECYLKKIG